MLTATKKAMVSLNEKCQDKLRNFIKISVVNEHFYIFKLGLLMNEKPVIGKTEKA